MLLWREGERALTIIKPTATLIHGEIFMTIRKELHCFGEDGVELWKTDVPHEENGRRANARVRVGKHLYNQQSRNAVILSCGRLA